MAGGGAVRGSGPSWRSLRDLGDNTGQEGSTSVSFYLTQVKARKRAFTQQIVGVLIYFFFNSPCSVPTLMLSLC